MCKRTGLLINMIRIRAFSHRPLPPCQPARSTPARTIGSERRRAPRGPTTVRICALDRGSRGIEVTARDPARHLNLVHHRASVELPVKTGHPTRLPHR